MLLVGIFQLADSVTGASMGILRGAGLAVRRVKVDTSGPRTDLLTFTDSCRPNQYLCILGHWSTHRVSPYLLEAQVGAIRSMDW